MRSFLQFTGKINKGIRKTINEEPHMFLAFNNGIAATADYIELDETGRYIKHIRNLQIVNGGQTTASIFNTAKKDKADISQIYVQVKLSVIEDSEQYADIVSRISQYANTQNKVNDADFTANNPALVEIEKFSRFVLSPVTPENNLQTNCSLNEREANTRHCAPRRDSLSLDWRHLTLNIPRNKYLQRLNWQNISMLGKRCIVVKQWSSVHTL